MTAAQSRPGLTSRQAAALRCITESVRERGFPPSTRELGQALGISSTSSVAHILTRLEWKGYLRRTHGINRGLQVLRDGPSQCPTCGAVNGGQS